MTDTTYPLKTLVGVAGASLAVLATIFSYTYYEDMLFAEYLLLSCMIFVLALMGALLMMGGRPRRMMWHALLVMMLSGYGIACAGMLLALQSPPDDGCGVEMSL